MRFNAAASRAELCGLLFDPGQDAVALLDRRGEGVEPLDGPLGHFLGRLQGRPLLVQEPALLPPFAERAGQVHHADVVAGLLFLAFEPRDLPLQVAALLGQAP